MEDSGSIPIITDPDHGGPKTVEQGDSKSRATQRAGQQQDQGDSKIRATPRAG